MAGRWSIVPGLFSVGLLSMSTQVYFLREAVTVFYGNELVLGLVVAGWMLITGLGALAGRYPADAGGQWLLVAGLVIFCLLPLPTLLLMDYLRAAWFIAGARVSLAGSLAVISLSVAPFCLLSGYLFTRLSERYVLCAGKEGAGRAYTAEAVGSLVAGLLVNFIFFWSFNAVFSLKVFTLAGLLLTFIFFFRKPAALLFLFFLMAGVIAFNPLTLTDRWFFPDQKVISRDETPYGRVTVTGQYEQLSYYENGSLLFSSGNRIMNEESVHPAMLQHPGPQRVLMISGGLSGAITEVRKYGTVRIDYLEQNPALIAMVQRYSKQLDQPGVHPHATDPRSFVRHTGQRYDVVLINTAEPSTLEANRFYTLEWFKNLKRVMTGEGVVSVSLPTTSDYVSQTGSDLNASLIRTLREVFTHVLAVPLGKNYFLASDHPLTLDLPGRVTERGIPTLVVNGYYLDLRQLADRSRSVMEEGTSRAGINRDFHPVTFRHQMGYWLSYSGENLFWLMLLPAVLLFFMLCFLTPRIAGIAAGGAVGASLQVLLIFALQALCGMIYQWVGILILAFMTGLAAGSAGSGRISQEKNRQAFRNALFGFASAAMVIPLLLMLAGRAGTDPFPSAVGISLLSFITGGFTGFLYGTGVRTSGNVTEGKIAYAYAADLAGAAAGTLLVSLFLFPRFGLVMTSMVLAMICLIAWSRTLHFSKKNCNFIA